MKLTEELMNGLEDTVKKYEGLIKKYYPTFTHDTQHILKINDIFKHLANDSPKTSQSKVSQHKHKDDKKTAGPVYLFK
jgi:regulator of sigma D